MLTESILRTELRPFSYYESLIPMYLKQSYGFVDLMRTWYDICFKSRIDDETSITSSIDDLFNSLNIYEFSTTNDYRTYINFISELLDDTSDNFKVLDMLADLFGVSRYLSVNDSDDGLQELSLTNDELVIFIKSQIIRNNFDGTMGQFKEFYKSIGLPVLALFDHDNEHSGHQAVCYVYMLLTDDNQVSQNIKYLFKSGLLGIESLGIQYTYQIVHASNIAIFDSIDPNRVFDVGEFI